MRTLLRLMVLVVLVLAGVWLVRNMGLGPERVNAEGALKRTIDHQVVNEYRGAISALNSGAPFMFTKADSALGSSVLGFARGVDKPAAAVPAAVSAR